MGLGYPERKGKGGFAAMTRELEDYVARHKIEIDLECQALPELPQLEALLAQKRFVFLGEPDHWIHEKYAYRLRWIDYLMQRGWRHLGMEMGHSDGQRYERYLQTGELRHLKRLALYGYPVPQQGKEGFSGLLVDSAKDKEAASETDKKQEVSAFVSEEMHFAQALWALKQRLQRELHYFGFDIDTVAGGAYEDLLSFLAETGLEQSALRGQIQAIQKMPLAEAKSALQTCLSELETCALSETILSEVRLSLQTLLDSLCFAAEAYFNPDMESLAEAYRVREQTMFRLFEHRLQALGPMTKPCRFGLRLAIISTTNTPMKPSASGCSLTMESTVLQRLSRPTPKARPMP